MYLNSKSRPSTKLVPIGSWKESFTPYRTQALQKLLLKFLAWIHSIFGISTVVQPWITFEVIFIYSLQEFS